MSHVPPGSRQKLDELKRFFSTAVYYLVYLSLTSQVRWPVTHLWRGSKKDSCRKVKPFYFYFIPLTLLKYILYYIYTMLYIHNIQCRRFFYRIILLHFYTTWLFLKIRHCITVHIIICCLTCFWSTYYTSTY